MTRDDALAIMRDVLHQVAPEADLGDVGAGESMAEALDLDSMDFLNFMIGLHERTGIEIPEVDYPQLSTIEKCVDYLVAHAVRRDNASRLAEGRLRPPLAHRRRYRSWRPDAHPLDHALGPGRLL